MLTHSHSARGQTLIETAICLPIVMLALAAVIYFCNLGIQSERVQLTARYGALNLFSADSASSYSAANVYIATVFGNVCPAPPTTLLSNGAPLSGASSSPFWNPSGSSSTCTLQTKDLGGASFLMSRYLTAGNVSVTANPNTAYAPLYYLTQFGGSNAVQITESLPWVHAAWPGAILACISKTSNEVEDLLTATETVTLPGGWSPGSCNIH